MGSQFITPINPATGLPYPAGGAVGGGTGTNQAPNPSYTPSGSCTYPFGQCTYGVSLKYPILNKMPCLGNACNWWSAAQNNGWLVSSKPYVGAIVVYACNLPGSGGYGHVAVVETVNNDGTFTVYEWNWEVTDGPDTTPRTVTSLSYIQGFFSPPGVAGPNTVNQPASNAPPATGARGLACQYPVTIPGMPINLGPYSTTLGGWNICMDGLIGVLAIGGGILIMAFAGFMAAKPYAEKAVGGATKDVGAATGQPEVAMAGEAVEAQGQAQVAQRQQRRQRSTTAQHLSVQEQETRRNLMSTGYSSVQATRGARAAGSQGTAQDRLTRGLRSLGSTS